MDTNDHLLSTESLEEQKPLKSIGIPFKIPK